MTLKPKLIAIGFVLAVSVGYAVQSVHASLLSVANSYFDELNSGMNSETNTSQEPKMPKQFDERIEIPLMDSSMTVSNSVSGSGNVSILTPTSGFCVPLSHSEKVYMLDCLWLPCPPEDDLLKVPISG